MTGMRSQRGVALITGLLIVSLATVAAVSFATQQQLDIRRTGNLIDGDEAWTYATAGEAWAKLILRKDFENSPETDNLNEAWAQPLPSIHLPGGYMVGRISDAQALFNLNNLVVQNRQNLAAVNQMQRLLILLKLDPNLIYPIIDWIDPDINATPPAGAEDDYYTGLAHPYRTANRYMGSASELRLVKGFNEKVYQRIAPYVTALPTTTPTLINVNTAPALILAVVANIDPKVAVALMQLRQDNPFKTTDEFQRALSDVAKVTPAQESAEGQPVFDVKTNYFNLTVETRIGYGRAALTSLVARTDADNIQVLQRTQGLS